MTVPSQQEKVAAYAAGMAKALKEAGLVKIAVNDDVQLTDDDTVRNPADGLASLFEKQDTVNLARPMPDNLTRRGRQGRTRWGAQGPGGAADTLKSYGASDDSIS